MEKSMSKERKIRFLALVMACFMIFQLAPALAEEEESLPWAKTTASVQATNHSVYNIMVNNGIAYAKLISLGPELKKKTSLLVAAIDNSQIQVNQDGEKRVARMKTILPNALFGSCAKTITFGNHVSVFKASAFAGTNVEKLKFKSVIKLSLSTNAFLGYTRAKLAKIKLTFNVKAYSTEAEQEAFVNKLTARGFKKANISFKSFQ